MRSLRPGTKNEQREMRWHTRLGDIGHRFEVLKLFSQISRSPNAQLVSTGVNAARAAATLPCFPLFATIGAGQLQGGAISAAPTAHASRGASGGSTLAAESAKENESVDGSRNTLGKHLSR